LGSKQQDVLVT